AVPSEGSSCSSQRPETKGTPGHYTGLFPPAHPERINSRKLPGSGRTWSFFHSQILSPCVLADTSPSKPERLRDKVWQMPGRCVCGSHPSLLSWSQRSKV
ncbi:hypothetical protein LEMLEM_LOCUS20849, partial [Lemmus lemmus]